MWVSSLSFFFLSFDLISKCVLLLWLRDKSSRETDIIRPARGQTDGRTDGRRHRQGPPYSTNTVMVQSRGTQHGKCLHHSRLLHKNTERGLERKLSPPATFCCHEHASCLIPTRQPSVCESVFLCIQMELV